MVFGAWLMHAVRASGMQCNSFYQWQIFPDTLFHVNIYFIAKVNCRGVCFPALIIAVASYRTTFPQPMACCGSFLPHFWQSLARANNDYYYPAYCSAWLYREYSQMQVGAPHLKQFIFSYRSHFPFRDVVVLKTAQNSCVMVSCSYLKNYQCSQ